MLSLEPSMNTMQYFEHLSRKQVFSNETLELRSEESSVSRKPEKLHSGVSDKIEKFF
jgi:hypothetical protein